jgi:hypothetical protein
MPPSRQLGTCPSPSARTLPARRGSNQSVFRVGGDGSGAVRSTRFTLRKPVRRPGPITTKPDRWPGRKKGEGRRNGPWQGAPLLFARAARGGLACPVAAPQFRVSGEEDDAPLPPSVHDVDIDDCRMRTSIPAKMTAVGPKTKALNPWIRCTGAPACFPCRVRAGRDRLAHLPGVRSVRRPSHQIDHEKHQDDHYEDCHHNISVLSLESPDLLRSPAARRSSWAR